MIAIEAVSASARPRPPSPRHAAAELGKHHECNARRQSKVPPAYLRSAVDSLGTSLRNPRALDDRQHVVRRPSPGPVMPTEHGPERRQHLGQSGLRDVARRQPHLAGVQGNTGKSPKSGGVVISGGSISV